jgi:hypothetical protein
VGLHPATVAADAGDQAVTKKGLRAAADLLRAILARVEAGDLTAPKRVVARLVGAVTALDAHEAVTGRRSK